jgi:3-oxoacyl-[acyl-carrier-protein] synthase I
MQALSVLAVGMVTGVGFDAPSTCAAIRAGLAGFVETEIVLDGEPVLGCAVPLDAPSEGAARLVQLVAPAIRACLEHVGAIDTPEIPLLLGVAEAGHPGRPAAMERELLRDLEAHLGVRFHPSSRVLPHGRVAGARGVALAAELVHRERRPLCLVAGADSLLAVETIAAFHAEGRILRHRHPQGFVPGEAGAAVLLGAPRRARGDELLCLGAGFGFEEATPSADLPLRGDGLITAIRAALRDAGREPADLDYRITDLNGEQYAYKEAALAALRLHAARPRFDLWHPADCTGEIGAAIGPLTLGVALTAAQKGYAPGPVALLHFASEGGDRAALVLQHTPREPPR